MSNRQDNFFYFLKFRFNYWGTTHKNMFFPVIFKNIFKKVVFIHSIDSLKN